MPTWSDKMVQEVIRSILEAYYEPQFSEHSHGFRPKRGCHTALPPGRESRDTGRRTADVCPGAGSHPVSQAVRPARGPPHSRSRPSTRGKSASAAGAPSSRVLVTRCAPGGAGRAVGDPVGCGMAVPQARRTASLRRGPEAGQVTKAGPALDTWPALLVVRDGRRAPPGPGVALA